MDINVNLRNKESLADICQSSIKEVIIQSQVFSRFGGIDKKDLCNLILELKRNGKNVVLAWDCLTKDEEIRSGYALLKEVIHQINAVRFIDPGVGRFLKKHQPDCHLQLSLEHSSLNHFSIQSWEDIFSGSLQRIILSSQLTVDDLRSIVPNLSVETEILGFGEVEIFYSRRKLLEKFLKAETNDDSDLFLASDDRPDQLNRSIQTEKGTILFYDKRINIFKYLDRLEDIGIKTFRIELYEETLLKRICSLSNDNDWPTSLTGPEFKSDFEGFYAGNETNRLFRKLTNPILKEASEKKIGHVLESVKNSHTIVEFSRRLSLPVKLQFVSPEDKYIRIELNEMTDLKGTLYKSKTDPGVYSIPWVKYIVPATVIKLFEG